MTDKAKHNSFGVLLADAILILLTLALDQIVKIHIRGSMIQGESFDVIPGFLEIMYIENTGSAFGMFKGQILFFLVIAVVVLIGGCIVLYRIPAEKKYILFNVSLALILSGALGNTVDRILKSSVTDFIYVSLINFPIFNIADIYIVCATALLLFLAIFVYKDEDLEFLSFSKKKALPDAAGSDGAAEIKETADKNGDSTDL